MTLTYRPARIDSTSYTTRSRDHTRPALPRALAARVRATVGLPCWLLALLGCHPSGGLGRAQSSISVQATAPSEREALLAPAPSPTAPLRPSVELVLDGESLPLSPERRSYWLAAHLRTPPQAHVYWKNPGSTGLPTRARFRGPPGLSLGAVRYPVPERFTGPGRSVGYGYQERTALLVEVPLDDTWRRRLEQGVSFTVEASWLACAEVCTRERGEATLWVQAPRSESTTHPPIAHYLKQRPSQGSALGLVARRLDAHRVAVAAPFEAEWVTYFPEHPLMPDEVDVRWKRGPTGELIVSGVPPGDHTALISLRHGQEQHHARIRIPRGGS